MIAYEQYDRNGLRELRAKRTLVDQELLDIAARMKDLDGELDEAVNTHQETAVPAQVELDAIEQRSIKRLAAGEKRDAADDKRRRDLQRRIEDVNSTLELARDNVKRRQRLLNGKRDEIVRDAPQIDVVNSYLFRSGDAVKIAEHDGRQMLLQQLRLVRGGVCEQLAALTASVKNEKWKANQSLYESRLPRFQAAAAVIESIVGELHAETESLRHAIIEAK